MLTGQRAPVPRKLFWRYKTNAQQAARDGDWKYLKIRDNTFLFDVVADPRERANLKHRRKDVFDRLVADWNAWNAAMLPRSPTASARSSPPPNSPTISARTDGDNRKVSVQFTERGFHIGPTPRRV